MKKIHKDIIEISSNIITTTSFIKKEIAKNHSSQMHQAENMPNHKIRSEDAEMLKSNLVKIAIAL